MKLLHICAGWEKWNGAANIARLIMGEQRREGHEVSFATWAKVRELPRHLVMPAAYLPQVFIQDLGVRVQAAVGVALLQPDSRP